VADELRKEPGTEVELVDGNRGEFTVLVNDHVAAKKGFLFKPSIEKIKKAVREAMPAEASR
jgi:hypothetical protein